MTEKIIRLHTECVKCLLNKYLNKLPCEMKEEVKLGYFQSLLKILSESENTLSAPEIVDKIMDLQFEMFGTKESYTDIKYKYNELLMSMEDAVIEKLRGADDPVYLALCYSMMGNYIDFGAMDSVDESKLFELLSGADDLVFENKEYVNIISELENAKKLVFLTDNCGEIVLDKILINEIKNKYPDLSVTVIVRGEEVLNDATEKDARQVGIMNVANVIGNGSKVAGTCLDKISKKALKEIDSADVIIAKGQGNFETMRYCGRNVYYLFMCKCAMFAERFGVPRFSGMLLNDKRLP